jgi:hypothetical protein
MNRACIDTRGMPGKQMKKVKIPHPGAPARASRMDKAWKDPGQHEPTETNPFDQRKMLAGEKRVKMKKEPK